MAKKTGVKRFVPLFILLAGILAIVIAIVATPTKFYTNERDDGNYDLELSFVNRVSSKVKVPAEYDGKKVTSFLVEAYYNDDTAFAKVKTIILEEGLEEINLNLLSTCPNLEKLELPSTIKAVYGTISNSVEVVVAEGAEVELKTGCFINTKTMTVTGAQDYAEIPDGVKVIGDEAFSGAKLKTIKIPASVEHIGNSAFAGVEVEESVELTFGANLKYVGYSAFASVMTIDKVTFATEIPLSESLFGSYKSNGATLKTIVIDKQPYVVESINDEKLKRDSFTVSAANHTQPTYIYLKEGTIILNNDGKISELKYKQLEESDLEGYKKYTTAENIDNKDAYYLLMYQSSTSDY